MSHLGKVLVTGGGGAIGSNITDELVLAGAEEIVVLDNFVRGRRENLDWAVANGPVRLVEGDIRDQALVRELMEGTDVVFHLAAIRITQCAEEPRLALEVLVDGTYNVVEAAAEAGVRRLIASSSASVYGLAEEFPTTESQHPYANDTLYGAAKVFNEGLLRSFHAMKRARLRRAALLQRLRPADGRARPLHRGARPLDGAHQRRPAAADPRRPASRRWTSSTSATWRARTCSPRSPTSPTASTTSPAARRRACSGSPRCCSRVMGSDLSVEFGPERAVNGVTRRARRHDARTRRTRLRGRGRARGGPDPAGRMVARRARR